MSTETDWSGTGWRCWRVTLNEEYRASLRNPWTNSGQTYWWQPGQIQSAECFWLPAAGWRCRGLVSASCTCGIRSMATLTDFADFMRRDRQLARHPEKASVVGKVRIGGRIQRSIPGLRSLRGYQRSEFAEIIGPLYVSSIVREELAVGIDLCYSRFGVDVRRSRDSLPRTVRGTTAMQDWLDALATKEERDSPDGAIQVV